MSNAGAGANLVFAAIDIGASSGRVILGRLRVGAAALETVYRFPNGPSRREEGWRWDIRGLFDEVLRGLAIAANVTRERGETIGSIGIDTWAVDYGLVRGNGELVGDPFSYRDDRSKRGVDRLHSLVEPASLYDMSGIQFLPFNTLYQLACEAELNDVQALLIPDLLGYLLTGERRTEITNASTTGLLAAATENWSTLIFEQLGFAQNLFPTLIRPGERLGPLQPGIADQTGLPPTTTVVAVGSHDTASAVAAVPADGGQFAYISSGTWSLVGVELPQPILSEDSRAENFTNERGVDGTFRFLRNVGGLWLLSECQRQWQAEGLSVELEGLLGMAGSLPGGGPTIDVDDARFIAPDNMPERMRAALRETGAELPSDPASITRCIIDSLADGYARTIATAQALSGVEVKAVHIVGGGSQNALLCQLTADAAGRPVMAGPVEATAFGNILIQARAAGALQGDLAALRAVVRASNSVTEYRPRNPH